MSFLKTLHAVTIAYVVMVFASPHSMAQPVQAQKADIRVPQSSTTEFYVRLNHKPKNHNIFFLNNPNRLVIDVMNMGWQAGALSPEGVIQKIRYGKRPNGAGRIVLDLASKANLADFNLIPHPREDKKWLLTAILHHAPLDKYQTKKQDNKKSISVPATVKSKPILENPQKPAPLLQPETEALPTPKTVSILNKKPEPRAEKPLPSKPHKPEPVTKKFKFTSKHKFRNISKRPNEILIVIDAGHGGNDPGAISKNKRREKDIVLRFAKELYRKINNTKGMRAVMTRDRDFYIPLGERVAIAQHYKADLFLSVHADALQNTDISGATIYSLSDTASDEVSAEIAKNENRSDIIAGVQVPAQETEVADILLDLLRRETDGHSYEVAEQMVQYMARSTSMMPKPHRKAGFAVLKAPDIPSVLIELGYLTNAKDEQNLINRSWRSKMVFEMVTAIKKWHIHRRKGVI